MGRATASV